MKVQVRIFKIVFNIMFDAHILIFLFLLVHLKTINHSIKYSLIINLLLINYFSQFMLILCYYNLFKNIHFQYFCAFFKIILFMISNFLFSCQFSISLSHSHFYLILMELYSCIYHLFFTSSFKISLFNLIIIFHIINFGFFFKYFLMVYYK